MWSKNKFKKVLIFVETFLKFVRTRYNKRKRSLKDI